MFTDRVLDVTCIRQVNRTEAQSTLLVHPCLSVPKHFRTQLFVDPVLEIGAQGLIEYVDRRHYFFNAMRNESLFDPIDQLLASHRIEFNTIVLKPFLPVGLVNPL